jgi:hypothetical protein
MSLPTNHTIVYANYGAPAIETRHSQQPYASAEVEFICGQFAISFFFGNPDEMEQFAATLLTASENLRAFKSLEAKVAAKLLEKTS